MTEFFMIEGVDGRYWNPRISPSGWANGLEFACVMTDRSSVEVIQKSLCAKNPCNVVPAPAVWVYGVPLATEKKGPQMNELNLDELASRAMTIDRELAGELLSLYKRYVEKKTD